jgi:hypothetical protein
MFHKSPLLLFGFLIGVGLLVALFGKLGLGTNTVLPAIAISAAVIGLASWGWKRFFRGKALPDKKVMFKALTTGTTRPASQRALVQYQSQYMDRYGVNAGARGAPTNEVYDDEEFDDEEFDDEEFDDEEFDDEEFDDEEFDDEEFEDEEDFNDERPDRVVVEEVQVERYQPRAYPQSRPTGPHGMREQRATNAPMNARLPLPGQRDAASLMQLAKDLMFHPDKMLSGRVSIFGLPNSGKSNLVAKLCEELGREELDVPFVLADTEDEYSQLVDERRTWLKHGYTAGSPTAFADGATPPPHFIAVDPAGAYYFGQMVLDQGFQVVLNLESYDTEEEAAIVMCEVVRGMRDWEQEQISDDRVSCFFILEEAATWLPQNTSEIKERLTPQTLALLQNTMFNTVVRKGRKRGLGFIFATQRPAEIDKRAMKSSWRFLMWQTEKNDLDVYEEMCPQIDRTKVQQFRPGEAVVMGPGIILHTRLFERRSPDCAKTPGLASVRRRYGTGQRPRFDTQDLAQFVRENSTGSFDGTRKGAAPSPTQRKTEAAAASSTTQDGRVLQFQHPSQQPQANTEQQLVWGCAVLNYLNQIHEPFTATAVRRPRKELRSLAIALEVIKADGLEIIGGGARAERIKAEVEELPARRMLALLQMATEASNSEQQLETR